MKSESGARMGGSYVKGKDGRLTRTGDLPGVKPADVVRGEAIVTPETAAKLTKPQAATPADKAKE